jgi:hypothetical protein
MALIQLVAELTLSVGIPVLSVISAHEVNFAAAFVVQTKRRFSAVVHVIESVGGRVDVLNRNPGFGGNFGSHSRYFRIIRVTGENTICSCRSWH